MLVKATLTHLDTLETVPVLWNPRSYSVARASRLVAQPVLEAVPGRLQLGAGARERFTTRLFFDSTESEGVERDLRRPVERLERWAEPEPGASLPPRLLFLWGSFRFRGVIEELRQEWVRFDPDGTPVRAWIDVTLRR